MEVIALLSGILAGACVTLGLVSAYLLAPDAVASLLCTAPENLPCRPLTLECLFAGAGGLAAGLPAVPPGWGGFPALGSGPVPSDGPYREEQDPTNQSRDYAPEPPPSYQPPRPSSPQDALNDPAFKDAKDQWARDNADRAYPTRGPDPGTRGATAADVLVESIRNSGSQRR